MANKEGIGSTNLSVADIEKKKKESLDKIARIKKEKEETEKKLLEIQKERDSLSLGEETTQDKIPEKSKDKKINLLADEVVTLVEKNKKLSKEQQAEEKEFEKRKKEL